MADASGNRGASEAGTVRDLVYVGFNSRVAALDRYTGEVRWQWKAPQGSGYTSVLLDADRLIVAVNGYIYCLDPIFGQEVWRNPMKGFGLGVTSIASANASSSSTDPIVAAAQQRTAQQAAAT